MVPEEQELKERLLVAAQRLFAERGRDAVSLRDIADEAGATHGSIRHHFGTKDNLYLASLLRVQSMGDMLETVPLPQRGPSTPTEGEEQLRTFIQRFVAFQAMTGRDQTASMGLIRAEMLKDGGPDPVFYNRVISPGHDRIKRIIKAIRPDIEDESALEVLAFNVIFQCVMIRIGHGIVLTRLGKRELSKKDVANIARLIADTTITGLRGIEA